MVRRMHYLSGVTISLFIALHLLNHMTSVIGAEYHISLMKDLRIIYRNPLVESILLAGVLIQIISGIRLFFLKRKVKITFFEKLQIWTGLYLAFFLVVHVSSVLSGRFIMDLDTNFYFGVAGLNTFPLSLFFIPYYSLAITSFFGHIAAIHYQKMNRTLFGIAVLQQARIILWSGVIITLITFYGLTNRFQGVTIPKEYKVMTGS